MEEIIDFKYKDTGTDSFSNLRHSHGKSYEIILVHSGSGSFLVRDRIFPLVKGGVYFINGIETHFSAPEIPEKYCRSKLVISSALIDGFAGLVGCSELTQKLFGEHGGVCITPKEECTAYIDSEFRSIEKALASDSPLSKAKVTAGIINILLSANENLSDENKSEPPHTDKRIAKLMQYINDNLGSELSLEQISSMVHISRYYLCHTFKKHVGMPVFEYIFSRRLSKAKHYLANTDIPISQIAEMTGFSSFSYFSKIFKENEKITPSKFRLENK